MSALRTLAIALLLSAFVTGCSVSTEDLAAEVQADIEKTLSGQQIKVKSFGLTKKGGNEYKGILKTVEPLGEFTYAVEVIYDGGTFTWEIEG